MRKPKILVLYCGGTLIMQKNREGSLQPPNRENAIDCLLSIEPALQDYYDIDIKYIANIDSTNMKTEYWENMAQEIIKKYDNYDGFLITHGTDTMAYTASALSFALNGIGKPVVLTGAQIPSGILETDARRNLVNACKLVFKNVAGVYLVFDKRIIKGVRASKISESALDGFFSRNDTDAGEISIHMKLKDNLIPRHESKFDSKIIKFEPNILVTSLTPGSNSKIIEEVINDKKIKGLIIEGFGPGNIPYDCYGIFEKARSNKIPVVVLSQCIHGVTSMTEYDVGLQALKYGVIEGHDMTLESTSTKLMWAIANFPFAEIKNIMHTNYFGEINIPQK